MLPNLPQTASDELTALLARAAAAISINVSPPRLPLCLTYAEAGQQLGIGVDKVRALVNAGTLDRPVWSRTVMSKAIVTTASVAEAAGWPVTPLEVTAPEREGQ